MQLQLGGSWLCIYFKYICPLTRKRGYLLFATSSSILSWDDCNGSYLLDLDSTRSLLFLLNIKIINKYINVINLLILKIQLLLNDLTLQTNLPFYQRQSALPTCAQRVQSTGEITLRLRCSLQLENEVQCVLFVRALYKFQSFDVCI